jgi:inorganic pyrophosphatase
MDTQFWTYIDQLVAESSIVIDRPKGSAHPKFADLIYPLDYGYLEGTISGDGHGIDIWLSPTGQQAVTALLCTIDLWKRDMEIKILLGCSEEEIGIIEQFVNGRSMCCTVLRRPISIKSQRPL